MTRFLAEVYQPRFSFSVENNPSGITSDGDDARSADFRHQIANVAETVITVRTVVVADAFARANVMETLGGRGAPAGVISCIEGDATVAVTFDDERTSSRLIDMLFDIATAFVPQAAPALDGSEITAITAIAARELNEPALEPSRIIETYLP